MFSNMENERGLQTAVRGKSKLKPWRKNVYDNKGYKDNYTDASFLEELKRNINFKEVPYSIAFIGAGLVTQQFCVVVLFSLVFTVMDYGWTEPNTVLYICGSATLVGYMSRIYLLPRLQTCTDSTKIKYSGEMVLNDLVTVVKCLAFGHILSPVLKTLTETICTDTIQAASATAFLVHIASYDYGIGSEPGIPYMSRTSPSPVKSHVNAPSHWSSKSSPQWKRRLSKDVDIDEKDCENHPVFYGCSSKRNLGKGGKTSNTMYLYSSSRVSSALSLNAAIFGATCLASRLASPSHAFALLSTAGLAFALTPPYLKLLHGWPPSRILTPIAFVLITTYSIFLCCGGISSESDLMVDLIPLAIFLIVVLFLNVLCPVMFVWWQAYKDNIYGPWDEAIPLLPRSAHDDTLGNT